MNRAELLRRNAKRLREKANAIMADAKGHADHLRKLANNEDRKAADLEKETQK